MTGRLLRTALPMKGKIMKIDDTDFRYVGDVQWHSSEEGAGPDVGILMNLGRGKAIWAGEISRRSWEEAGPEIVELGSDNGWWLQVYDEHGCTTVAKFVFDRRDIFMEVLQSAFIELWLQDRGETQSGSVHESAVASFKCALLGKEQS